MKPVLSALMVATTIVAPISDKSDMSEKSRVEVTAARTEYDTTFANPDGTTTVIMSANPVRVRRGTTWVPADATLERRPDRTIVPRAAVVDMAFSAGGDEPLARIRDGKAYLEMSAPMHLPPPVLAGNTATYPEVLPGTDLVVTASTTGFSEVLVVKNRAAAANPALATLRFGLGGTGLSTRKTRDGGVEVRDRAGTKLLAGPAPTMWDSRQRGQAGPGRASAEGPVEGNRVARLGLSVGAAAVTLRADRDLLTDPGTVFPVFIDPSFDAGKQHRTMVNRSFPTSNSGWFWGRGNPDANEGMGYVSTPEDGTHLKRLYFAYDTSRLRVAGRTIVSATFRTKQVWAYSCNTNRMQVWLSNGVSENTTWNNQPSTSGLPYTERNVATAGRAGCNPGGSMLDFDVENQVIRSVLNNWATTTLMLRAADETSSTGWRRFNHHESTLEVVYNTFPNVPSSPQMISPPVKCGGSVPALDMPIMQVKATDPDGTDNQVKVEFQIWKAGASTWAHRFVTDPGASGATFRQQIPNLANGSWSWIARTTDNQNPNPLTGGWTNWCNFVVDNTAPAPPLVWFDGGTFAVGQDVRFHFTGGGNDVTQYRWAINNDVPSEGPVSVFDGRATVRVRAQGPFLLRVWAYDAAGNRGSPAVWGGGDNPVMAVGGQAQDWWRFDEGTGTTTANQKAPGNGLLTSGGVTWESPGYPLSAGSTMVFNGTNAHGAGMGQPGPVNGNNFTVSVWARPASVTGKRVLIAQDGDSGNASFSLAIQTVAGPKDATGTPGPVAPRLTATLYKPDGTVAFALPSRRIAEAGEWLQGTVTLETLESGDAELHLYTVTETDPSEIDDSGVFGGTFAYSRATSSYLRVAAEAKNWGVAGWFSGAVDEAVAAAGLFDDTQRTQWRYPPVVTP
ncbi:DNRLRE domain-containing protein [Actinoplanes sp. NPDC051861]|uniref:DNRLRE domain-containing protein n=1 Tax=Actinoplanes sp. NPDC051861 TaxID=3155170 RepID=UPI003413DCA3